MTATSPVFVMPTINAVYIHYPYCHHKCPYCDFYAIENTVPQAQNKIVTAIQRDLELNIPQHQFAEDYTLYLGGGTPSQLSPTVLEPWLTVLPVANVADKEWTIECNPEDVSEKYLCALRELGFNRLSLGIQSFSSAGLEILGRKNTPEVNRAILEIATKIFANVSIDMIYAWPGQTEKIWQEELAMAFSFPLQHLSAYALTVTRGSRFYEICGSAPFAVPDENILALEQILSAKILQQNWNHYEISSYAKTSALQSRHNITYWQQGNWLGIGPSAVGQIADIRLTNPAAEPYIDGEDPGVEVLVPAECLFERLMTGLRLTSGISLQTILPGAATDEMEPILYAGLKTGLAEGFLWQRGDQFGVVPKHRSRLNDILLNLWGALLP